jgi:hypothetical protein
MSGKRNECGPWPTWRDFEARGRGGWGSPGARGLTAVLSSWVLEKEVRHESKSPAHKEPKMERVLKAFWQVFSVSTPPLEVEKVVGEVEKRPRPSSWWGVGVQKCALWLTRRSGCGPWPA